MDQAQRFRQLAHDAQHVAEQVSDPDYKAKLIETANAWLRLAEEAEKHSGPARLEHDPEKWIPVFGKDHAPTIS